MARQIGTGTNDMALATWHNKTTPTLPTAEKEARESGWRHNGEIQEA